MKEFYRRHLPHWHPQGAVFFVTFRLKDSQSYDRVIRDNEEYIQTVAYVLENPVKAGLVSQGGEWQWAYCKPELLT